MRAVTGTQDWMAIVYYICFGIIFLPFILDLLCPLFAKKPSTDDVEESPLHTPRTLFSKIRPLPIVVTLLIVSVGWNIYQYTTNDSLQSQLDDTSAQLNVVTAQLKGARIRYSETANLYSDMSNSYNRIADNYEFWENHACVVPSGSSTYHIFPSCPRCDASYFHIYNTEQAENLGYSICNLCDIMD